MREAVECPKRLSISLISSRRSGFVTNYSTIRLKGDFSKSLHNLFLFLDWHYDEESQKEAGLQYFRRESCFHLMDLEKSFKHLQQLFSKFDGAIPPFVLNGDQEEHPACIEFNILKKVMKNFLSSLYE